MQLARRFVRTQAGRTLLVLLVGYVAWLLWARYQAEAKIDDDVAALVDQRGLVDVEVELAFPPERFHILVIQDHGRIRRTIGDVVHVRIEPGELRRLARRHWIVAVRPAEDPLALFPSSPRSAREGEDPADRSGTRAPAPGNAAATVYA